MIPDTGIGKEEITLDPAMLKEPEQAADESLEKIFGFIEEKKYFKARDELLKHNEADIAEMFEEMLAEPDILESTIVIYRLLPKDVSVEVFSYLPSDDQLKIVRTLGERTMQVDDSIEETEIPTRRVLSALTMLELDGVVEQSSGKRFSLAVTVTGQE